MNAILFLEYTVNPIFKVKFMISDLKKSRVILSSNFSFIIDRDKKNLWNITSANDNLDLELLLEGAHFRLRRYFRSIVKIINVPRKKEVLLQ